jgi:hypothetical protein
MGPYLREFWSFQVSLAWGRLAHHQSPLPGRRRGIGKSHIPPSSSSIHHTSRRAAVVHIALDDEEGDDAIDGDEPNEPSQPQRNGRRRGRRYGIVKHPFARGASHHKR